MVGGTSTTKIEDASSSDADYIPVNVISPDDYYINREVPYPYPCVMGCYHILGGCRLQLKPCAFYNECFRRPSGVDPNAQFLFEGVIHGFDIVDDVVPEPYNSRNYSSILNDEFKVQMDKTVADELSRDKVSIAVEAPHCVHALGAVRKASGKLRPITDCRRPLGVSINNHMETTCSTFSYTHIDHVTDALVRGSYMAVLDIKAAYRSVNINPDHRKFQGFVWDVQGVPTYFTDNCLCFGLKCAPWLFTQLTEFVIRAMNSRGFYNVFGYLDDFLAMGNTESDCRQALDVLANLLLYLGFDLATEKIVNPSTVVKYLGLEIDSIEMELRLPQDKLDKLVNVVSQFASESRKTATKHDLDSLCGVVSHASQVVRGGRTFSRRMINLANSVTGKWDKVNLPDWFKSDLNWWLRFCKAFNGKAPVIDTKVMFDMPVATDSSMTGFGAVWSEDYVVGSWDECPRVFADFNVSANHWAQGPSFIKDDPDINLLELWPVLVSLWRWGRCWIGCKVRFKSDNTQVVRMVNTGRSRSIHCMYWLRELFWLCFIYDLHIVAEYIRTTDNIVPDYLSRITDHRARGLHPPISFLYRGGGFEE